MIGSMMIGGISISVVEKQVVDKLDTSKLWHMRQSHDKRKSSGIAWFTMGVKECKLDGCKYFIIGKQHTITNFTRSNFY